MVTFRHVDERPNVPQIEEKILELWRETDMFKKKHKESEGKPKYTFYDGPPFATGLPHYGHLLAGSIKDVRTRYAVQRGMSVERRFGWDCHGLPIEFEIDKMYDIKTRTQIIEDVGVPTYNGYCRNIVQRFAADWRKTVERCGRWVDFDNDYKTMNLSFMESVWWVFRQIFDRGLVYSAFKVMPYSMPIATVLSNSEAQNYRDTSDPSIIVSFPCKDSNLVFLAWTTTPWTLPSNLGLCMNPELEYVEFSDKKTPDNVFVAVSTQLPFVCKSLKLAVPAEDSDESKDVIIHKRKVLGSHYEGMKYTPLFTDFPESENWQRVAYKVMLDEYVTDGSGTGIVHQAPAFGEDDYRVCMKNGVLVKGGPLLCPLDDHCNFNDEAPEFIRGMNVKAADDVIKRRLKDDGRLLSSASIVHSYPFCWRSDTPLIYRAVPCWFINVEKVKDRLLDNNREIHWVPSYVGEGRFHNWLANARDWCVSRNRFWGTPMPLWVSEDGSQVKCIGSVTELQQYTDKTITDLHCDCIDHIRIPDPRGDTYPPMKRIPEVFDCWFESGSMPYASKHYPFEQKEEFQSAFPADFIGEGLDQTRGWFYTLIVISTILFDKPAFKNCIVNGLILASDGKKMSKRLQNYPAPNAIFDKYGADALRVYLLSSPVVAGESIRFQESGVHENLKNVLLPIYHGVRFLTQEVTRLEEKTKVEFRLSLDAVHSSVDVMDRWILAELEDLTGAYNTDMEAYRLYRVGPRMIEFLESLTNTYIRFNRDRLKGGLGDIESLQGLQVLSYICYRFVVLLAAFCPFMSEHLYDIIKPCLSDEYKFETVHEILIPDMHQSLIQSDVIAAAKVLQSAVNIARTLREKQKVPLKTPIKAMTIVTPDPTVIETLKLMENHMHEEMNVLDVMFTSDQSCIKQRLELNFKKVGKRLGKDLPKVKKVLEDDDGGIASQYQKGNMVSVLDHVLEGDDVVVMSTPKDTGVATLIASSDPKTNLVLIADFERSNTIDELAACREIANRIQKLRKKMTLQVQDNTVYMRVTGDERVQELLQDRKEMIEKLIRRSFFLVPPETEREIMVEEPAEINYGNLTLTFFK